MRSKSAVLLAILACALALPASVARAESHIFIVANQADGYGVDECLANGEKCGAHAARSYCQSRDYAQASSYRRVDPAEFTGSIPKSAGLSNASGASCSKAGCSEYVAITCQR